MAPLKMADPADALAPVERWLTDAVSALEPEARKKLMTEIGRELRTRTRRRMAAQQAPDGTPWRPRKRAMDGRVKSYAKMMQGLRDLRRLDLKATPEGMELGWSGRNAMIANVHQMGDVDEVHRHGPRVKYTARPLIGLPPDDLEFVRQRLLAALPDPP